jgi:EmrB/QacA subfamily drug resistance transporter
MCFALATVIAAVASLNVALPDIARGTGATQTELQWLVDGYALVFAALLLPAGALGDRYGRKPTIIAGLTLFGGSCFAATASDEPSVLIAWRLAAGVGAALTMPVTLSVITDVFPEEQRSRAVGLWAGVAGAGGTIGLLASGALLEVSGWEAVFALSGGMAAVSLVTVIAVAPSSRYQGAPAVDWVGGALSAGGLGALVYAITEGPHRGWDSGAVLAAFAAAVVLLAAFVWAELRREHPLLDPRLFRIGGFTAGSLGLTVLFLAIFGFFFLIVQHFQWVAGYSPLRAGFALAPMGVTLIVISPFAATFGERIGVKAAVSLGMAIMAAGLLFLVTLEVGSGYGRVVAGLLVIGAGMGLAMPPATSAIVNAVPPHKRGVASAVNDATREVGAAIGIALFGSLLNDGYRARIETSVGGLSPDVAGAVRESFAAAMSVAGSTPGLADAARLAFLAGQDRALYAGSIVLLVGAAGVIATTRWRRPGTSKGRG